MTETRKPDRELDLRGIACPVNWAHAKAALAAMAPGEWLALLVDDPRASTDIPVAAEMEGHCLVSVRHLEKATRITIEV